MDGDDLMPPPGVDWVLVVTSTCLVVIGVGAWLFVNFAA